MGSDSIRTHSLTVGDMDSTKQQFLDLLAFAGEKCLYRDHFNPGHITGSCLIVNYSLTKVVLMYHKKSQLWCQFGGHCDGYSPYLTAIKELNEEFGDDSIEIERPVFLLDIHPVEARGNEPKHLHYDVNYLAFYDDRISLPISPEGIIFYWFSLDKALVMNETVALNKMVTNIRMMKEL